ncbi:hypothetical protein ACRAWD_16940 [Caulobacter segnis]
MGGALSRRYDRWRDLLVQSLAMLEAAVDFPDEDLPERRWHGRQALRPRASPAVPRLCVPAASAWPQGTSLLLSFQSAGGVTERAGHGLSICICRLPGRQRTSI